MRKFTKTACTAALGAVLALTAISNAHAETAIDLSSNNGVIQHAAINSYAASHKLIGLKVNEGGVGNYTWWQEPQLADWSHTDGMNVLGYDFGRPDYCNTRAMAACGGSEAVQLFSTMQAHWKTGDKFVLDLEIGLGSRTDSEIAQFVQGWLSYINGLKLGTPIVYTGWWYVGGLPKTYAAIAKNPIWFAAYQANTPDFHKLPVVLWQDTDCTSTYLIPGCTDSSIVLSPDVFSVAAPKPVVKQPTVVVSAPKPKNPYPLPKKNVDVRRGSKASGSAVQWVEWVVKHKTCGSLHCDPTLTASVIKQEAGWGLAQDGIVGPKFKAVAMKHGL